MENAADALKMAAAVLIFVLALSISINAFGEVRQTSKIILDYKDREYDYTYVSDKDEDGNLITERIVSAETIVPSIYKAYKENYKIVFKFKNGNSLYQKINGEEVRSIDLEKDIIGNDTDKEDYIKALLYGRDSDTWDNFENKYSNIIEPMSLQNLREYPLYDIIKEKRFKEYLGIYIQEEVYNSESEDNPDANKTEKRVITYEEKI